MCTTVGRLSKEGCFKKTEQQESLKCVQKEKMYFLIICGSRPMICYDKIIYYGYINNKNKKLGC